MARLALAHVGVDPEAEAIWVKAINDPSFSPKVREDLIEDLNEEGLNKKTVPADLPLINHRIQLIEELAPDAMDGVNAAAFAEAYKDLVKMRDRLNKR